MQKHITRILSNVFLKNFVCYLGLLTTVLAISSMDAKAQNDNFSINRKQATILSIIEQVEQTSKYRFFYNNNVIDINQKVSVNLKDASIETLLNSLFRKSEIVYSIENKKILLAQKGEITAKGIQDSKQSFKSATGSIFDERGDPVIGASVVEKGTSNGVITDLDGKFSLPLRGSSSEIQVSYIGYITTTLKVTDAPLKVIMKEDTHTLDEVIIVGFGVQKRVNLTGAVSSVKMDEVIGNRPVTSALDALEGSVPGLQINKVSGKPGVAINANIRGVTSVNGGEPLVLVDNVPMDLELVNPNDIESVSVLKDAAASAIYGARAAFGVILVTTKQGQKDTPVRVTYTNNFSFSKVATAPERVTPRQTLNYYKDAGMANFWCGQKVDDWMKYLDEYENEGKYPEGYTWGAQDNLRYNLAATDPYSDMLDKSGFQQSHDLAVSGGGSRSTYRISLGMINEDGILVTDKDSYKRYNASGFISMDATPWLTTQLDTKYTSSTMSTAAGTVAGGYNIWSVSSAKESSSMAPLEYGTTAGGTTLYPIATPRHAIELSEPKINRVSNIRLLGRAIIKPLKGWTIIGEYTYNRKWASERTINKTYQTLGPDDAGIKIDNATNSYSMQNTFNTNNVINIFSTYQRKIQAHDFSVMAGFNQEEYHYELLKGSRTNLIDQDHPALSLATGDQITTDNFNEQALRSLFYRATYSYNDRYLFEANGRYDGSSRFPKKDRFGFFPSFSAAWRISEEPFMESIKKVVDNVKIRASWGNIGNQNTGNYYSYLSTVATNKPFWLLPGATDWVTTLNTPGLISSTLTWEKVSTLDFGLDFVLLGKLSVTGDYYIRDTKDMLGTSTPLPSVLGSASPKANVASLRTKGWEISIEWKDKIGKDFSYRLGFNLYDSQAEITDYYNPEGLLTGQENGTEVLQLRKGMKFGEIWGYETDRYLTEADFNTDGTIKSGIPLLDTQTKVYPGDIIFVNKDGDNKITVGDNTINNPGDQIVIGNRTSRYQYGITGGVKYKNFDLSFFFNGVGKKDMWLPMFPPVGKYIKGVETYQLDYWTTDNPNGFYPRISANTPTGGNTSRQTKYMQDGSFFRMKNLTLGYNVPKDFLQKFTIQSLRLFFSAENLFTIDHLPKGYMPDQFDTSVGAMGVNSAAGGDSFSGLISYPIMKQFSFGLNVTF